MTLVALVGIDGAGKSTAARALTTALQERGRHARYFENPGGRPMMNQLARRQGHDDGVAWLGRDRFEAVEMRVRHAAMRRAQWWGARPDRIAVCDRWMPCQYALMAARGSDPAPARERYRGLRSPERTFYLALAPERAQERIERRGTDHETLTHLRAFDAAYRALPEFADFTVVDADTTSDSIVEAILAHLDD
ncbi:dTMP kinase [Nocardioides sp.]|uniref:dTMP kinase n=1 Tax=Nocardioides sp. TaxID=35761 RepID=UPI0035155338